MVDLDIWIFAGGFFFKKNMMVALGVRTCCDSGSFFGGGMRLCDAEVEWYVWEKYSG